MADFEYGVAVDTGKPVRGSEMAALMNWLGAWISLALIAGLAFWGYQLMVRDVSGVPVVRALSGPMRVAPEDPGGLDAEHQGLAVNRIAAAGTAAAPADRLVLAPAPTSLNAEDQTAGEIAAASAEADSLVDVPDDLLATDLAVAEALTSFAEAGEPIVDDQAALITAALQIAETGDAGVTPLAAIPAGQIAPEIAGVARSPRPSARPAIQTLASVAAPTAAAAPGAVKTVDPTSIVAGTRLAQLGAFESPELAQAEWHNIATKFEDVMGDKAQVIQRAQSGGKSFYRLRVMGFQDISDARRFCSTLLAGKAACIPVITR